MSAVNVDVREDASELRNTTDEQRLWKVLGENGKAYHGGTGSWPLPKDGKPGEWLKVEGRLIPCQNGLHLCRDRDLTTWLGPLIWLAEARGEQIDHEDKIVVREARLIAPTPWNERVARLFAADCAERILHRFEDEYPGDDRPRSAIETARRFASGRANQKELFTAWSASRSAASAVNSIAAQDAACGAACCVQCGPSGDAAASAAYRAASSGPFSSEREWQTERLIAYLTGTAGA